MTRPLTGRRVVLGVCGGIAAYKAIEICRRLVDVGAHVVPVMTRGATRFVGEVTLSALASEKVQTSLWSEDDPIPHTRLGQSADVILVAPATARVIGAYAAGISNDLLTATLLASRAPVVIAPAMHTEMWEHLAVQDNVHRLRRRGVHVVEPGVGRLAGGDTGAGRLAEPDDVVAEVVRVLSGTPGARGRPQGGGHAETERARDLDGVGVLVTAGGTREPIDPVRFVGNRSSGKQGHAIADEAFARGARVWLVTTSARLSSGGVEVTPVETAEEMLAAVRGHAHEADIVIMAAAVADFRPKAVADEKLKKADGVPELVLEPTPDILAELGRGKAGGQVLVGFAAETEDVAANAAHKLARKGLDLVVANDVSAPDAGFEHDTNEVLLIGADGSEHQVALTTKEEVARAVIDAVVAIRTSPDHSGRQGAQ